MKPRRARPVSQLSLLLLALGLGGCNRDGALDNAGPGPGDLAAPADLALLPCAESKDLGARPALPMAFEGPTVVADHSLLLAAGDLDGDGRVDLVESAAGALQVEFGKQGGGYENAVVVWKGAFAVPVAAAILDLDGDGALDLVASGADVRGGMNGLAPAVAVIRGGANRTFHAAFELALAANPGALVTGDFNGDGHVDLAAIRARADTAAIDVFAGNGDGTLRPPIATPFGKYVGGSTLAAADWNGDGRLDVALDTPGIFDGIKVTGPGALVALGRGDGTFAAPSLIAVPTSMGAVAAADWNADGKADVAVTFAARALSIVLGNGDGTFQTLGPSLWDIAVGAGSGRIVAADFNGDGRLDAAVEDDEDVDVAISLGRQGGLGPARRYVTGDLATPQYGKVVVPPPVIAADFDGDGRLDVGLSGYQGPVVLAGSGDGGFRSGRSYGDDSGPWQGLVVGDFDHDGLADFVTARPSPVPWGVLISWGSYEPWRTTWELMQVVATPTSLAGGDVNHDGHEDLVLGDQGLYDANQMKYTGAGISVYPTRQFGDWLNPIHADTPSVPFALAVADLDGDGFDDVATANLEAGTATVLLSRGDGTFRAIKEYPAGPAACAIATGDLNGDGAPDLLVGHYSAAHDSGGAALLVGDGRGHFGAARELLAQPTPVRAVVIGDLDGDARTDAAVLDEQGRVIVLLGRCDGTLEELAPIALTSPVGHAGFGALALADLDGNGLPDLLIADAGTDQFARCFERCPSPGIHLLANIGQGHFTSEVVLGAGYLPQHIATRDLDGDGRLDIVVQNEGGTFSVMRGMRP